MSNFKVGDTGFINGTSPHEGLWSVVIENISKWGSATLRFDGVVVPPSAQMGIKNPQGSPSHTLQPYILADVTPRTPQTDDEQKRKDWLIICAARDKKLEDELILQNAARLQKYSHVKVGTNGSYKTIMGWGPQEYEVTISVTVTEIVADLLRPHLLVTTNAGKTLPLSFEQLIV